MGVFNITTTVVGKDDVIKRIAVAYACRLPILLIGVPGVAKSKLVLDFARGVLGNPALSPAENKKQIRAATFVKDLNQDSRANSIIGMPSFKKLFEENVYQLHSPIAKARIVIINEVDKGSSDARDSLLSVMNERQVFDGEEKIDCAYELFIATANTIPAEELGSPFWDRFNIKVPVEELTSKEMESLLVTINANGKQEEHTVQVTIPTREERQRVKFSRAQIKAYQSVLKNLSGARKVSDRSTIRGIEVIAPTVALVYGVSPAVALVKTVDMMVDAQAAEALAKSIEPKEVSDLRSSISLLGSQTNASQLELAVMQIENKIKDFGLKAGIDQMTLVELHNELDRQKKKSPAYQEAMKRKVEIRSDNPLLNTLVSTGTF